MVDPVDEVSVQRLKVPEATFAADPIDEYPMQQSKEFDGERRPPLKTAS